MRAGAARGAAVAASGLAYTPPTATPTLIPTRALLTAIAAKGGADVWGEQDGALLGQLKQGARLVASERSDDTRWIFVQAENGVSGWVSADALMIVRPSVLPARAVDISPAPPTPVVAAGLPTATATPAAVVEPVEVPAAAAVAAKSINPEIVEEGKPKARVGAIDSRLNLRAGPGTEQRILAKAEPGDLFTVLGRDGSGEWLLLRTPAIPGGLAWATAAYLELDVPVVELPISREVNDAPATSPASNDLGKAATPKHAPQNQKSVTGLYGKLVFQTQIGGDIYLFDMVSGQLRKLTTGIDPALSPDGKTVAFTRDGGEHGLYLIDIDGQNERNIFGERELFRSPKWSPDGNWIVFSRGDDYLECRKQGDGRCFPESWFNGQRPGFDFGHLPLIKERKWKLARVDFNGENYRDLVSLDTAVAPDWSDSGIVYQSKSGIQRTADEPQAETELIYFDILKQYEEDPDWRQDGGPIIFQQREASHWEIYTLNPDGSGLTALTRPATTLVPALPSNVSPAWNPQGNHIRFSKQSGWPEQRGNGEYGSCAAMVRSSADYPSTWILSMDLLPNRWWTGETRLGDPATHTRSHRHHRSSRSAAMVVARENPRSSRHPGVGGSAQDFPPPARTSSRAAPIDLAQTPRPDRCRQRPSG
ncbi:MAG: SH3 domain-containing protein [Caldilineaceae bacterium]|nr:SH3 domain-containing protein [Caldilineaceae bacterium]